MQVKKCSVALDVFFYGEIRLHDAQRHRYEPHPDQYAPVPIWSVCRLVESASLSGLWNFSTANSQVKWEMEDY